MDNNIFSTFNTNHLSDILIDNNLVGGNDSSLFQYVIIIAIISLVIIVIYYLPYKKEIFDTTPAPTLITTTSPILPVQPQSQVSLEQISNIEKELQEIKSNLSELKPQPQPPLQYVSRGRMFDPIAVYDYRKLYDPLVDPRGRTSADEIPTLDVALQLNIPTQGFPDTYHRVGLLIQSNGPPKRGKKNLRTRNGTSLSSDGSSLSSDGSSLSSDGSTSSTSSTSSGSTYSYDGHVVNGENNILELVGKKMGHNWYRYFTSISIGNKIIKINVNNKNRRELYDDDKVYIPELSKWYRVKIDRMDMIDYSPYNLY
jgi:hypothetical protein